MAGVRMENGKVINPEGLEVNATLQCNLRCTSCSHLSPLFGRENVDPAELHDTLAVLATAYHASFAKILGGEPLLHPDLTGVLEAVRASEVADTILVCTNGTRLDHAPDAFWAAVDAVEVSVYPSHPLSHADIRRFQERARRHGVDLLVNYYGHFRVAYSEQGTDRAPMIQEIFDTCKLAHVWHAHTVYRGWLYRCPQSIFLPRQVDRITWSHEADGIEISASPLLPTRLMTFLSGRSPLRACRYCLGSVGMAHPHTEAPRGDWRQPRPTEEVIDHEYLELARRDITIDDGCVDPVCPCSPMEAGR
jgi:organic radical activating enzyme